MARGRAGTTVSIQIGGAQVVEAPSNYSTAQATKARRPHPRASKPLRGARGHSSVGKGDAAAGDMAGRKRQRAPSWEREYQQIWKTVNELGAEQFTGKAKRAYEARKIVERGGRAPKEATMPYVMLQGLRKKAKQREQRRQALEAEAGVVTGNAGSARRKSAQTLRGANTGSHGRHVRSEGAGRGRGVNTDRSLSSNFGPAPSMGMMKSGVLHISRKNTPAGARQQAGNRGPTSGDGRGSGTGRQGSGRKTKRN